MKRNINIFATALILLCVVTGCKKYLDVVPDNIGTIDYAFRMRTEAEKYLYTCYNNLPYFGDTSSDPGFMTGDELAAQYPSSIYFDIGLYRIARGEQNIVNPIGNYWDGDRGGKPYYQAIRECNLFLENVNKVPDLSDSERKRWIAEVKLLKAYYHFFLFRMYGPIPVIRKNLPVSASIEEVRIPRMPVDSVVNYVVSLIDEAAPDLPAQIMNQTSELGRLTKPIALSIKAQVLITAASPLFNGNPGYANFKDKTGVQLFNPAYSAEKWRKAVDACKEAITAAESAGAALYYYTPESGEKVTDSTKLTMNIRAAISDKWNSETIWGASNAYASWVQSLSQARITSSDPDAIKTPPADNESIRSTLSPPIHIAEMFYSNNGVPIEEDVNYDYANRLTKLRTVTDKDRFYLKKDYETIQLNFDREPRFYADLGFDGGIWYGQGLYNDAKTWFLQAKAGQFGARLGAALFSVTGYWPKKLVNYKNDFGSDSKGYNTKGYPWPVIRLSEMYLLYAEALNELNGPSAEAYKWIDLVRKRAGLKGVVESWASFSKNPAKPSTKDGFREIIQREQMIELVFEGKRVWSIRRWKKAEEYFNKPIRGWDLEQEDAVNYYRVRQIVAPVFTSKDYLWPLSENSLVINPKLVQNPGW
ncbi:RagB/SusD family nutrient uptake outer membrane protein [Pedobacter sp.]|uniref:RagB/SusD family nutrient uptake outer membrane protein n=1 Tax=Pedobacter sp. TaxID=1411316 RepID=UPI002BE111BC|nr:RagB/SusD family nutrient uptake outer membrane protein [Pedobacter sp.]HWW42554.1 RagB/SusD family nutrient uptake outer membrane protein [Pedobacter sp.]